MAFVACESNVSLLRTVMLCAFRPADFRISIRELEGGLNPQSLPFIFRAGATHRTTAVLEEFCED